MNKLTNQIIELWNKKELRRPTQQEIADKLLVTRQYVNQVIIRYTLEQKALGKEIK